jgi:hypothetical protein
MASSTATASDPEKRRSQHLARLNRYFSEGSLRILVGAGVSIAAGYPSWDTLNTGLLRRWISKAPPQPPDTVDALAKRVLETLGREAAADFVWQEEDPGRGGEFFNMLAQELYGGRPLERRTIPDLVLQLACMAGTARIYTTNYDPVLEVGLKLLRPDSEREWHQYRAARGIQDPMIRHVHGWVDPDGHHGGTFVLAESHYIELQHSTLATPNRDLSEILDGDGAVLIVGMSLTDPNLRRLLYQRSLSSFAVAPTYAIVKETPPADPFHEAYWRLRKTTLIFVPEHDLLLPALRQVQFGVETPGDLPRWLPKAGKWLESIDHFTDAWQDRAWQVCRNVAAYLRGQFSVSADEEIQISIFRSMADAGELRKVASTKPEAPRSGAEARQHAVNRRLNIRVGEEQGVAGRAFLAGVPLESINQSGLNYRFDDAMKGDWGAPDFKSLVAVPVFRGELDHWLPIGVAVLTSSREHPFWEAQRRALPILRRAAELLLTQEVVP